MEIPSHIGSRLCKQRRSFFSLIVTHALKVKARAQGRCHVNAEEKCDLTHRAVDL